MSEPSLSPLSEATQPPASAVSLTSSEEVTAFLNEAASNVDESREDKDDNSQDGTYQPSELSDDDTASQGTQVVRGADHLVQGDDDVSGEGSTMIRLPRVQVQEGSISGSIFGGMNNSDFQERMAALLQMINELNEATRAMRNQVQRLHNSRNRARTGRETVMAYHILPALRSMFFGVLYTLILPFHMAITYLLNYVASWL
ncbi:hypothetical protein ONZ45_g13677 [Pleurotus djamor]|nr:hypothetical protein ONZ45_g13677 [Pleurotus djamor]